MVSLTEAESATLKELMEEAARTPGLACSIPENVLRAIHEALAPATAAMYAEIMAERARQRQALSRALGQIVLD